jgi:prolyl 4-hydroxylase
MVSSVVLAEDTPATARYSWSVLADPRVTTMQFETLNSELKTWLQSSIGAGHGREALKEAMRTAGYDHGFAQEAIEAALAHLRPEPSAPAPAPAPAVAPAEIQSSSQLLTEMPNTIATSDRLVEILMVLNAPRVVLFGNVLSAEECDQLVEASRTKLQRSTVVNADTGAYDVHPHRTSSGTHFERGENELIRRIESRIAELIDYPVENGEPIQILHYLPGAEYKPHYDYFDPKQPGNETVLAMGGQRIATLVLYLNDVEAGGSTVFPTIGLDVLPRKGSAVYFAYTTESGETDARTLHGGSPVIAGEKWIATKWLRQRQYGGPGAA